MEFEYVTPEELTQIAAQYCREINSRTETNVETIENEVESDVENSAGKEDAEQTDDDTIEIKLCPRCNSKGIYMPENKGYLKGIGVCPVCGVFYDIKSSEGKGDYNWQK